MMKKTSPLKICHRVLAQTLTRRASLLQSKPGMTELHSGSHLDPPNLFEEEGHEKCKKICLDLAANPAIQPTSVSTPRPLVVRRPGTSFC